METKEEFWKFVESENHFNDIQAGIRNRASVWILYAFAAIAILLKTSSDTVWSVPSAVLIGLVSLMATIGLLLLWINDQLVYQRLLDSIFIIGLKYEHDNPELPPIRTMMMCSAEGKGMPRWMTYYYTIPMICFLFITGFVIILRENIGTTSKALTPDISLWIIAAIFFIQVYAFIWVQFKKSKTSLMERAQYFKDDDFSASFSGTEDAFKKFRNVIERYQSDKRSNRSK